MGKDRRSVSIPNERLKQERLLRGWTQADLAGFLGTDGYTVNRWERGRAYPGLHFRRKLCDLFAKDALDLGLLPAQRESPDAGLLQSTVPPLYWSVPHPRNLCFTGRSEVLQTLHNSLMTSRSAALVQTQALYGLGGIGKTQIALEYVYQRAQEYSAVFWIEAETVESILSSLLRIAEVLQVSEHKEADQQHMVVAVQHWLAAQSKWLLIWDNLEDLGLLQRFLPPVQRGAMLITTRNQALGTLAEGVNLEPMRRDEGALFVLRRAKMLRPETSSSLELARSLPAEYAAAEELVTEMGGLPLALDQAGAYLEETGCSLTDYLQRYRRQRSHLLQRRGQSDGGHPRSVATTFLLAYERVEQKQASTGDLLRVCALLHAEAIPEELFLVGATHLGPVLVALAADPVQFDQMLATLRSLSLVQRYAATHTLSLHRLIQAIVQEGMSEQERTMWLERITAALNAVFPAVISDTWKQCERLLSHVLTIAAAMPVDSANQELGRVLCKTADYLRERGQYEQARQIYRQSLQILEQVQGSESEVACCLTGLALLAYEQGSYKQAEELYQRARHTLEQAYGLEHLDVTRPLINLAVLYATQGKYAESETLYLRAQRILEQGFGPEHPKIAYTFANLAEVYLEQGRYAEVEPLCKLALSIWQQAFGPKHSLIAYPTLTLARLYMEQGKDEQAELLYHHALAIWEYSLDIVHPLMADAFNGLAHIYVRQKKYTEAEVLYQRTLNILGQAFGTEHPDRASALNGLANLHALRGRSKQARLAYQQALLLQEQHLGRDHPKTAQTLYDLATFYQHQGNQREATTLMRRALEIRASTLGDAHPKTIATRAQYIQLVKDVECLDSWWRL